MYLKRRKGRRVSQKEVQCSGVAFIWFRAGEQRQVKPENKKEPED